MAMCERSSSMACWCSPTEMKNSACCCTSNISPGCTMRRALMASGAGERAAVFSPSGSGSSACTDTGTGMVAGPKSPGSTSSCSSYVTPGRICAPRCT